MPRSEMTWNVDHWDVAISSEGSTVTMTLDEFVALETTQYVITEIGGPGPAPEQRPQRPTPGGQRAGGAL
jgi:hypothetical protein